MRMRVYGKRKINTDFGEILSYINVAHRIALRKQAEHYAGELCPRVVTLAMFVCSALRIIFSKTFRTMLD